MYSVVQIVVERLRKNTPKTKNNLKNLVLKQLK